MSADTRALDRAVEEIRYRLLDADRDPLYRLGLDSALTIIELMRRQERERGEWKVEA